MKKNAREKAISYNKNKFMAATVLTRSSNSDSDCFRDGCRKKLHTQMKVTV